MTDTFDPEKLKENAITSIRLGVEDFTRSQAQDGDPGRALSALRNLFAGILLLFKYRIATKADSSEEGAQLIFKTGEILPQPDGDGGFHWKPSKFNSTTIDVPDIRKRFEAFGIKTDWKVIDTLHKERNHAEHLHPQNAVGAIGNFLSATFPVLSEFIETELGCSPADLLGETWRTMLEHHDFYMQTAKACEQAWLTIKVPDNLQPVVPEMKCGGCGSSLLRPSGDEGESTDPERGELTYVCISCTHREPFVPLLEETLEEFVGGYDPFSGEDPPTAECPECAHRTFVHDQRECLWCGMALERDGCVRCGNTLSLDDYGNSLCGYCQYVADKHRDD